MQKKHPELEIEDDLSQQKRIWVVERIGWLLMFLFIVAVVLGFTGRGGLLVNKQKAGGTVIGLEVEYERFLRQEVASEIQITFHRQRQINQIKLNKEFLDRVRIEQILPEPSASEIDGNGVTYSFNSKGIGAKVFIFYKPKKPGGLHYLFSDGTAFLSLNHFVYP